MGCGGYGRRPAQHHPHAGRRSGLERSLRRDGAGRARLARRDLPYAEPGKTRRAGAAVLERLRAGPRLLTHADQPPDRQEPRRPALDEGGASRAGAPAPRANPHQGDLGGRDDDRRSPRAGRLRHRPLRQVAHRRRRPGAARLLRARRRHGQRKRLPVHRPQPRRHLRDGRTGRAVHDPLPEGGQAVLHPTLVERAPRGGERPQSDARQVCKCRRRQAGRGGGDHRRPRRGSGASLGGDRPARAEVGERVAAARGAAAPD